MIKRSLIVVVLLLPLVAYAQSGFDGTWKVDLGKAKFPTKPDTWTLQNGTYQCSTCVPPITVKADGTDQKVTGHPRYDTVAVREIDKNTVEMTFKKSGKTVSSEKDAASADGNTLLADFVDHPESGGKPVTGKATLTRVSKGPAGSHAISGSWRTAKVAEMSENGLVLTFKSSADGLTMTAPTGESYDAKFDGKDYPYKGNANITSVSLKKVNPGTIEETDKRDGKIISVATMTLQQGGKSMNVSVDDKLHGTTASFVLDKR